MRMILDWKVTYSHLNQMGSANLAIIHFLSRFMSKKIFNNRILRIMRVTIMTTFSSLIKILRKILLYANEMLVSVYFYIVFIILILNKMTDYINVRIKLT